VSQCNDCGETYCHCLEEHCCCPCEYCGDRYCYGKCEMICTNCNVTGVSNCRCKEGEGQWVDACDVDREEAK
jgi:hypothetical protein